MFLREILAKNLSGREALELAQHYLSLDNRQETVSRRRSISLNPEDIELKENWKIFYKLQ